jgi:hypothetical protein
VLIGSGVQILAPVQNSFFVHTQRWGREYVGGGALLKTDPYPVANMASLGLILPSVIVPSFVVVSAISAFAVYKCRRAASTEQAKNTQQSVCLLLNGCPYGLNILKFNPNLIWEQSYLVSLVSGRISTHRTGMAMQFQYLHWYPHRNLPVQHVLCTD